MERTAVESSQIISVGWEESHMRSDEETGEVTTYGLMDVEFKGGSVYRYQNVPAEMHAEFMAAESKGKFLGETIKKFPDRYPFTKIRGTDREEAKKAEAEGRAA